MTQAKLKKLRVTQGAMVDKQLAAEMFLRDVKTKLARLDGQVSAATKKSQELRTMYADAKRREASAATAADASIRDKAAKMRLQLSRKQGEAQTPGELNELQGVQALIKAEELAAVAA